MRKLICALTLSAIVGASPAFAGESGTLHLKPQGAWVQAVPDRELGEMRGGFFNLAFSAVLTAFIENGSGNLASAVNVQVGDSPTLPTPSDFTNQNGEVRIASFIGSMSNVNGIINVVQVPGSNNNVFTQLVLNIAIVNVGSQSQVPSLQSLFVRP